MNKSCIIFDNDDQSEIIQKLERDAKSQGIQIECLQFNVGSTSENDLLTEGKIDRSKVITEFKKKFKGMTFHLAAFDWDLSDDIIDGVELIRILENNRLLKNTPKLLYSGLLEERLSSTLDDFKKSTLNKTEVLNKFKALIKADIKDFVPRENYERDIIRILRETDETLDLILENELNKFPDFKFSNRFVNDNFKGKSFADISKMLEENDHNRNEFKKEIVQQVIAYLTEKI